MSVFVFVYFFAIYQMVIVVFNPDFTSCRVVFNLSVCVILGLLSYTGPSKVTNSSFLAFFFGYFQALLLVANLNQNKTYYSVLEMVKCEQQYSGRFVAIYSTYQKLFVKN
jgi:hypothetical protein